jgi:spermidine/putrescine transport system permease protein
VMGMVYNFIPFMILPIYTALSKMDIGLIEAADDLGADKKTIFRKNIYLEFIWQLYSFFYIPQLSF